LKGVSKKGVYFMFKWPCIVIIFVQITNKIHQGSKNFNFVMKLYCFWHLLCPSSGFISCTRENWYVSCRLCGRCLGESGWNTVPIFRSYELYTGQLVCFMQVVWPLLRRVSSNLTLLSSGHVTSTKHTNCHVYSW
jgi:hypothetical protein